MGRPKKEFVELTEEQQERALDLAADGETLKKIRETLDITQLDFRKYRERYPLFETKFQRARQDGLEELVDALQTIPEEIADVNRARLKSENIRWLASKRKPAVYGDRLDVNVTQTVDIGQALADARSRAALPIFNTNAIVQAESITIPGSYDATTTDCVSVAEDLSDLLS